MQNQSISLFFQLIRISLGESADEFPTLTLKQWEKLYTLSYKQAVIGVLSIGIEKLPENKRPPREVILKWLVTTERIKQLNQHINKVVEKVESLFYSNNFQSCILKGQGMALLYPYPELRTPGDIDIWIKGNRKDIASFIIYNTKSSHMVYHHIDGLKIDGVGVETHFTPSYMSNPFANKRLQRWIKYESTTQFKNYVNTGNNNQLHIPTLAFNRVFILHHIYRHFFYEGIGLRQMMDFYFVLKQGFTTTEKNETLSIYNMLNLTKFAGAAIYVLQEIFGLEKNFHIVPPDDKFGKVLLSEILAGGNFGQANTQSNYKENTLQRGWRIIKRSWKFLMYTPDEVFWIPYFKVMNNLFYVRSR